MVWVCSCLPCAHSLPRSPSPGVPHQAGVAWRWLSGCGRCKTCGSLPPYTSWVTSVTAYLLGNYCFHRLSVAAVTLLGCRYRAFASGGILLRYFSRRHRAEGTSCLLQHYAPATFSASLQRDFFDSSFGVIVKYFAPFLSRLSMNESGVRPRFPSLPLRPGVSEHRTRPCSADPSDCRDSGTRSVLRCADLQVRSAGGVRFCPSRLL